MTDVIKHSATPKEGLMVTTAAKEHFIKGLQQNKTAKGIRFSLKKTGCSGLSYVLDYVSEGQDLDLVFPFALDYVFFVEKAAYPLIKGLKIDYIKEGLNKKLVFFNPNQTGQCGCGESFSID